MSNGTRSRQSEWIDPSNDLESALSSALQMAANEERDQFRSDRASVRLHYLIALTRLEPAAHSMPTPPFDSGELEGINCVCKMCPKATTTPTD